MVAVVLLSVALLLLVVVFVVVAVVGGGSFLVVFVASHWCRRYFLVAVVYDVMSLLSDAWQNNCWYH